MLALASMTYEGDKSYCVEKLRRRGENIIVVGLTHRGLFLRL